MAYHEKTAADLLELYQSGPECAEVIDAFMTEQGWRRGVAAASWYCERYGRVTLLSALPSGFYLSEPGGRISVYGRLGEALAAAKQDGEAA